MFCTVSRDEDLLNYPTLEKMLSAEFYPGNYTPTQDQARELIQAAALSAARWVELNRGQREMQRQEVKDCPRCGGNHTVTFRPVINPAPGTPTHWATCPLNGLAIPQTQELYQVNRSEQAMRQEVKNCPRCGGTHTVTFRPIINPVPGTPTHWATCPMSDQPIFPQARGKTDTYYMTVRVVRSLAEDLDMAQTAFPDDPEAEALKKQLAKELQAACDNGMMAGMFEVTGIEYEP